MTRPPPLWHDLVLFLAIPAIMLGLYFTAMNDGTSPDEITGTLGSYIHWRVADFMDGANDTLNLWRKDKEAMHLAAVAVIRLTGDDPALGPILAPFLLTPPIDEELMAEAKVLALGFGTQAIYDRLVALREKGVV